ncbi:MULTISPECIES: hypothetical protein [Streptococcus]|jgi:hypothetical protein|uniref:Uncharacterized protein n=3 Tax=Streptococcus mitis group TaxID=3409772 RepID=A0A3B0BGD0_9STRE|nr:MULTISPECIES: hypothetical protein [Streptococcus]EPR93072.1 hypothetical protein M059_09035 [Streptococcus mitis 18/56]KYF35258.1 hypothetical protein SMIM3IV_00079 [Streptococcus mitis]MBT2165234.1 hypothetical protein [Streptococcus mitis]OFN95441.1 hypothetical protein HMPREF2701_03280 [Streptococcus sp. HMSC077D04]RKN71374.1 hypothetical protein D7D54_08730 [Streptococcus chosunense]
MDDYNIFDHWDGNEKIPKSKFEGLSNDEVIEILKQELLEKEEEEKREEERKKQAFIKAKKDKEYKEYSAKVERLFKWMIGFALFAVISAGYWYYKDYFFLTVQGGLLFTGPTKVLGKAIIEFILSIMLCFLAPALLVYFIVDLKQDDEEK